MDWELAVERNHEALKRILVALAAMAGLSLRGDAATRTHLPRSLHRACLRLLRPAESAVRRLVIVAARGLSVTLPPPRPRKAKPRSAILRNGVGTGIVMPVGYRAQGTGLARKPSPARIPLRLLDPLPRFARRASAASGVPRVSSPGFGAQFFHAEPRRVPRAPQPDDPIATARLKLRLEALASALDDLPAEARRFARWRTIRARMAASCDPAPGRPRRFRRLTPLRPGRPPGSLVRPTHEVHEVLADLNFFALRALERPDTS